MQFVRFNLQSSFEGFLTKKKTDTGLYIGVIYPKDTPLKQGDILVHIEHFEHCEDGTVNLLKIDTIDTERPAKGQYKDELNRPTYRLINAVKEKFTRTQLIEAGIVRVENKYDEKVKRYVEVLKLTAA